MSKVVATSVGDQPEATAWTMRSRRSIEYALMYYVYHSTDLFSNRSSVRRDKLLRRVHQVQPSSVEQRGPRIVAADDRVRDQHAGHGARRHTPLPVARRGI